VSFSRRSPIPASPAFDAVADGASRDRIATEVKTRSRRRFERTRRMTDWVKRHPLASYFFVAYILSWSIAVPLALQAHGFVFHRLPWSPGDFGSSQAALARSSVGGALPCLACNERTRP